MVKDKPLIHTVEENKDEPHYHNVSGEKLFEGSRIIDLLFVIKQLKDGCTVCGELQNVAYLETETGLASIFYLKCICDNINAIYSGSNVEKTGNVKYFSLPKTIESFFRSFERSSQNR